MRCKLEAAGAAADDDDAGLGAGGRHGCRKGKWREDKVKAGPAPSLEDLRDGGAVQ
jgi:hypothetical protein